MASQNQIGNDSMAILSYTDKIIIKANLNTQTESYTIESKNDTDFHLATNNKFELSLSLDYEFIGVSIGFSPKFLPGNNENDLKGKSSFQDYGFRFFLGNWTQELRHKRVESFYVENTNDFIPLWIKGQDPYIQFPGFKTIFWGGSTSYVLNPNFSLRNVVYNTEWQLKSTGSLIPTLRYGHIYFSLLDEDSKSYENSFDISLSPDYYYTFVIRKNWFASLFLSPAFGVRFASEGEEGIDAKETHTYWPLSIDGGLQLGYSSSKIIFGANLKFETTWYTEHTLTSITNNSLYAKIYFGYRLNTPKAVRKIFNPRNKN